SFLHTITQVHLHLLHAFPSIRLHRPRPHLFPYTTLFRSYPGFLAAGGFPPLAGSPPCGRPPPPAEVPFHLLRGAPQFLQNLAPSDRKSTRLNSSHVSISYAVFCLKKKNK